MVTIKRYDNMFLFSDPVRNISYPIDKQGLIKFITEDQDELIIDNRGGKRVYNTDARLKGIEKPVDNIEECEI